MCGICGICNSKNGEKDISIMMEALRHRGPDAAGICYDEEHKVGLGHRRLSILDLSEAGNQPMKSQDGQYVICLNGEIYNHKELRDCLPKNVLSNLKSTTDTEVLVESFAIRGIENTLNDIRGMYAIALYHYANGEIKLIRDRAGEKPLYYGFFKGLFVFSSELKAIQAVGEKYNYKFQIDYDAVGSFLQYSCIPAPLTIYKEIKKVLPGSIITVKADYKKVSQEERYWSLHKGENNKDYGECKLELRALIESSVKEQMIADVPYGAFLSGGIDSSLTVLYMQKMLSNPVKTFSVGFENPAYDEAQYAKSIASYIGTNHHEMIVSASDALSLIPALGKIYDEPYADSSQIPTYFVSKFAKTEVAVALTGDAGDELFCGYEHYIKFNTIYTRLGRIPAAIRNGMVGFSTSRFGRGLNRHTNNNRIVKLGKLLNSRAHDDFFYQMKKADTSPAGILRCADDEPYYRIGNDIKNENFISNMQIIDFDTYLPNDILVKVDRAAMANSLETRVPFLDKRIIEYAYSMPLEYKLSGNVTKRIIRDLLYEEIPKELLERPKQGFGIPLDDWLKGCLREWAESYLYSETFRQFPELDFEAIDRIWSVELSGKYKYKTIIWNILMLAQWIVDNKGTYCV